MPPSPPIPAIRRQYEAWPYPKVPLLATLPSTHPWELHCSWLWDRCGSGPAPARPRIWLAGCGTFQPYVFRVANPRAEIRIAGGREGHLGALQALALYPANSLFVEGYLTTRGSSALATYRMIRDAGFVVERADGSIVDWSELGVDDRFRVDGSDDLLKPSVRRPIQAGDPR